MDETENPRPQASTWGYRPHTHCRACGELLPPPFLDLGMQPLANSYKRDPRDEDLARYPLAVAVCHHCWLAQLTVVVNPDTMFRDYLYVSGTSDTLRRYFSDFAQKAVAEYRATLLGALGARVKVLDIACNDGSQLDAFRALGCRTYGVDPARNLTPVAIGKGHEVMPAYWTRETAEAFVERYGEADIIVAQNVFAHVDDILGFLEGCKKAMNGSTRLYIQTSQATMFHNGEFDTLYHEHLSYFNTLAMKTVVERAGLSLENIGYAPIHGTSYVFTITKKTRANWMNLDAQNWMLNERDEGLYDPATYSRFAERAEETALELRKFVEVYRKLGMKAVGVGAAAKGMTVLNYAGVRLDRIVDDNPLKQGLFTPRFNVPIEAMDGISDEPNTCLFVLLAWNFKSELKEKIKRLRPGRDDLFLTYFPDVVVSG